MPLEIDEIAIRMLVGDDDDDDDDREGRGDRRRKKRSDDDDDDGSDEGCCEHDREQIVRDCVRRVLAALREREQR